MPTIDGTINNDFITGTLDDDIINGLDGDDTIHGSEGNDVINGGDRNDTLYGDSGDDTLNGDAGNDILDGGFGTNILNGGDGNDRLYAIAGTNVLNGDAGSDVFYLQRPATVNGGTGGDYLDIYFFNSTVALNLDFSNASSGGIGTINGYQITGVESVLGLWGSAFSDNIVIGHVFQSPGATQGITVYGYDGNDNIYASQLNDYIYAGAGSDIISGWDGDDYISPASGNFRDDAGAHDFVDGGSGIDSVRVYGAGRRQADGSVTFVCDNYRVDLHNVEYAQLYDTNITIRIDLTAVNDVNRDNVSDLLLYTNAGGTMFHRTTTNELPGNNVIVGSYGDGAWDIQAAGDMNGDGYLDWIVKNGSTGVFDIWTAASNSGGAGMAVRSLGAIGTNWDIRALADVDGNFSDDIVYRDSSNGRVYISFENFTFGSDTSLDFGALGTGWDVAGASDLDGDYDSDILLRNSTTGQLYVYKTENQAFAGGFSIGVYGANWAVDGIGDFNGDHIADIALKNTTTGQFYLLLMDNAGSYTGSSLGIIGTDWSIAATGDYTGDGTDDLLWRNAHTNQIYMWAMQDGHQAAAGSAPYGYLAADQIIV